MTPERQDDAAILQNDQIMNVNIKGCEKTGNLIRILFIIKLLIILPALILSLVFGYMSSSRLLSAIQVLSLSNPNMDLIDKGIHEIVNAENEFRFYIATSESNHLHLYKNSLARISGIIDSIYTQNGSEAFGKELSLAIRQKESHSSSYLHLKVLNDSLLSLVVSIDSSTFAGFSLPGYQTDRFNYFLYSIKSDTVIENEKRKKSFLNKVKELFSEDPDEESSKRIIRQTQLTIDSSAVNETLSEKESAFLRDINKFYKKNLELYSNGRNRLNKKDAELISLNTKILETLQSKFNQHRQEKIYQSEVIRKNAWQIANTSFKWLIIIAVTTFFIATLLLILILRYLHQLNEYSRALHKAKEKSEALADQKSNFLTSMSHEIRAPLNNIIGLAEQLHQEHLSPEQKKSLDGISTSSELLLATVNQILDFSTLESGKMIFASRVFNPYEEVDVIVSSHSLRAGKKRIVLKNQFLQQDSIFLLGDPFRLKQIVSNLLDNAIKYSDHGEIVISGSLEKIDDTHSMLRLQVSDQGIGIPKSQVQNIFKEFNRINDQGLRAWQAGSGLGLSICRRIVEQQSGTIEVSSQEGKGSVFSFNIPYEITSPEISLGKEHDNLPDVHILTGKQILLAEDDEFSRLLIEKICMKYQIVLMSTSDGNSAFRLFEEKKFDIILSDINMPGMDGFQLVRKVRQFSDAKKSNTPVLAVTANVMEEELRQIRDSGMNGYVLKPFREKELIEQNTHIISKSIIE